jgi:hypothetical protein
MSSKLRPHHLLGASLLIAFATPAAAQDKDELQKCDKPFGTLAVNEPQQQYMHIFQRYSLGSPAALLRMMAQNSNCFLVVERGLAMQNIQQERNLARSGEMQQDANMGGGQMKAADFVMTAAVQVMDNNAGGVGGVVGGLVGGRAGGLLGGGVKFKEANTSLLIADVRTTVQVAAAEGKARKTNFSLGMLGFGGAIAAIGGYSNTAEGKVIAASYLDNYNNIVGQLRSNTMMQARAAKFDPGAVSGDDVKAGASFAEGDVLAPKIDNVKLLSAASDGASTVTALKKTDDLVFLGEEKDGFVKVASSNGEGWVKKTLVAKK